jgi:hypothetical protein
MIRGLLGSQELSGTSYLSLLLTLCSQPGASATQARVFKTALALGTVALTP